MVVRDLWREEFHMRCQVDGLVIFEGLWTSDMILQGLRIVN